LERLYGESGWKFERTVPSVKVGVDGWTLGQNLAF
jgi:hypothetical protein